MVQCQWHSYDLRNRGLPKKEAENVPQIRASSHVQTAELCSRAQPTRRNCILMEDTLLRSSTNHHALPGTAQAKRSAVLACARARVKRDGSQQGQHQQRTAQAAGRALAAKRRGGRLWHSMILSEILFLLQLNERSKQLISVARNSCVRFPLEFPEFN